MHNGMANNSIPMIMRKLCFIVVKFKTFSIQNFAAKIVKILIVSIFTIYFRKKRDLAAWSNP